MVDKIQGSLLLASVHMFSAVSIERGGVGRGWGGMQSEYLILVSYFL